MTDPAVSPSEVLESPAVEFAVREQEVAVAMLVELIERMQQADKMIREMAEIETNDLEAARLHGKASGVGLCMGYFREALSAHRGAV